MKNPVKKAKKYIFYPMIYWSPTGYLQQDQVDLGAPLLPSDQLGPEEKEEAYAW